MVVVVGVWESVSLGREVERVGVRVCVCAACVRCVRDEWCDVGLIWSPYLLRLGVYSVVVQL